MRLRAPDCLPHQVKSADAKTTLLHYLATLLTTTLIDELKGELNSLPDAKEISLSDKKSELAKLVASVEQAQQQLDLGKKEVQLPLMTSDCDLIRRRSWEEGGTIASDGWPLIDSDCIRWPQMASDGL